MWRLTGSERRLQWGGLRKGQKTDRVQEDMHWPCQSYCTFVNLGYEQQKYSDESKHYKCNAIEHSWEYPTKTISKMKPYETPLNSPTGRPRNHHQEEKVEMV